MAAALENTTVTYEDLASIEQSFDDAEVEIMITQNTLLTPLYEQRTKLVSQIPNFWPLVLEQAPPDIDQYIQPSDSALLLSSLTSLNVTRFEPSVDPRSVSITLTFKDNEHFSNTVLEKKFWYRKDSKGFSELVSEPVKIDWKSKEKDLTGGLLDLVHSAWEDEQKSSNDKTNGKGKEPQLTPAQKQLKKKIATTATGGFSFFAWFGYIGRRVTAEESTAANEKIKQERAALKNGTKPKAKDIEEEAEEEDNDISYDLEIFPDGDDLAVAISEDLWPGALKYFTQAQEADALSDIDFESDDDDEGASDLNAALQEDGSDDEDVEEEEKEERPAKKQKRRA